MPRWSVDCCQNRRTKPSTWAPQSGSSLRRIPTLGGGGSSQTADMDDAEIWNIRIRFGGGGCDIESRALKAPHFWKKRSWEATSLQISTPLSCLSRLVSLRRFSQECCAYFPLGFFPVVEPVNRASWGFLLQKKPSVGFEPTTSWVLTTRLTIRLRGLMTTPKFFPSLRPGPKGPGVTPPPRDGCTPGEPPPRPDPPPPWGFTNLENKPDADRLFGQRERVVQ